MADEFRALESLGYSRDHITANRILGQWECARGDFASSENRYANLARGLSGKKNLLVVMERGWNAAEWGMPAKAAEIWRTVPRMTSLFLNYADSNFSTGDMQRASKLSGYALACTPECGKAHLILGRAAGRSGLLSDALRFFGRAETHAGSQSDPACKVEPYDLQIESGRMHVKLSNFEDAIACFLRAEVMAPRDPLPSILLADALWNGRSDAASAEKAYRRALQKDAASSWAYMRLSGLFLTLKQPDRALPLISKAEEFVNPEDRHRCWVLRGQAMYELGRFEDAVALLRQAAAKAPDDGWSHYIMGHVYRASGREDTALQEYKHAIRLLPEEPGVAYAHAELLAEMGRHQEAHHAVLDILRRKSGFKPAVDLLGRLQTH